MLKFTLLYQPTFIIANNSEPNRAQKFLEQQKIENRIRTQKSPNVTLNKETKCPNSLQKIRFLQTKTKNSTKEYLCKRMNGERETGEKIEINLLAIIFQFRSQHKTT